MSDLISRQHAIYTIDKYISGFDAIDANFLDGLKTAKKLIKELPSVQPEIIRCKDCKWCEDADGLMCKNPASWVVATDYDFGCVCAERRQDE